MMSSSSPDRPFLFKKMVFASCCLITLSLQSTATQSGGRLSTYNNCLQDSSMGNCFNISSSATSVSHSSAKNVAMSLPVDNAFSLPSPLPAWPPGGGFASGVIDLGGLLVSQVSSFTKVWATTQGGPGDTGFTFFEPSALPDGFSMFGSYAQPNNVPLFGRVLVGKDVSGGALRTPTDYTLVWHVEGSPLSPSPCYVWLPVCTQGYEPVGYLVTTTPEKPSLDGIRCVRSELIDVSEANAWIWGADGVNIYTSRPQVRGMEAPGMTTGSFVLHSNSSSSSAPACLRNTNKNFSSTMPNMAQIRALMGSYSPTFHFHPDEEFFPSSVAWFFENGALLYAKGNKSNPVPVDPSGENLPRGGSNDGAYWLDLPTSNADYVKKGNLRNATAYLHVKPADGGASTDVAVWVFYPFNGATAAKVEFLTVKLGKIGEHVGDWEHVTLRISNFDGALTDVYFSQHSGGVWESASDVEFQDGTNKPTVYSSKHGHAAYPKPGENIQGSGDIGIRNDTAKGGSFIDTGSDYSVVSAEYLSVEEPPWLEYAREWGPKISYEIEKEVKKLERFLPGKMKSEVEKIVREIPSEVLGEEGPVGPKWKDNWNGDERS